MSENLLSILKKTVETRAACPSMRYKDGGSWVTLTWKEVNEKILDLVGGLAKLGIVRGDRVCILSKSRYEWTIADLSILSCGAITVPIYESSTAEQVAYIIENCGAKIIFVEDDAQLAKVQSHFSKTQLKQIIIFDSSLIKKREEGVYTLDEVSLLGAGKGQAVFQKNLDTLDSQSEASYVYTSGTTGPPKGAILTHGNIFSELQGLKKVLEFTPTTESLLFLPLAHILARVVQFAQVERGFIQCYAESIDHLMANILEVRPHIMASVPRIFEKVHTRVLQGLEQASPLKKALFNWALEVGEERANLIAHHRGIPLWLKAKWLLATNLVFSKLHAKLGGRIQFFISGGAPLCPEIAQFFHAAGFFILEGYGLTETAGAVSCNSREYFKIGTVGKPLEGAEIKIAQDGEILVRGGMVFKGYYKRDEDTKEALEADGWFHTGDIGCLDAEGFLKITDRKKDIIVTAAGKNVAPQNIENLLKTDPMISQVMVHGDKRKFLSALVTLDQTEVMNFAKGHKIPFQDYADLVKNEKIYDLIKSRIEEKNRQLAKYETIKKFAILETDFSVESGELTPTMKVKRKFTSDKYKHILEQFYQD